MKKFILALLLVSQPALAENVEVCLTETVLLDATAKNALKTLVRSAFDPALELTNAVKFACRRAIDDEGSDQSACVLVEQGITTPAAFLTHFKAGHAIVVTGPIVGLDVPYRIDWQPLRLGAQAKTNVQAYLAAAHPTVALADLRDFDIIRDGANVSSMITYYKSVDESLIPGYSQNNQLVRCAKR